MKKIIEVSESLRGLWNRSVKSYSFSTAYHLWEFSESIEKTYGYTPLRFALTEDGAETFFATVTLFLFAPIPIKTEFVSIPFCDYGGIVSADTESSHALLTFILQKFKSHPIILRQLSELSASENDCSCSREKVRMVAQLEVNEELQFKKFTDKLRAQIRRPTKDGYTSKSGGIELLDDFYRVFVYNMRSLGSPVHSKKLMQTILATMPTIAQLFVVYSPKGEPAACSMAIGCRDTLTNPWASSDRRHQKSAPNMLLYWEMIRYAIGAGYCRFDFGRSTEGEGTYRFKTQWGAAPEPMFWYQFPRIEKPEITNKESWKKALFIKVWQRLPLKLTCIIGPQIRRLIHL